MKTIVFMFFLSLLIINASCTNPEESNRKKTKIVRPQSMDDGWPTASLNSAGMDSTKLQNLLYNICDNTFANIHSVLIIKNGKLVFEQYFNGYAFKYDTEEFKGKLTKFNPHIIHNLASVTKSVTSVLFGIAVDQGLIENVDEKLFKFFPQYTALNDSLKKNITLQHVLSMTSGLEWDESDIPLRNPENDLIKLFRVPDPVKYILSKPVICMPGTRFNYNGGNTNLLGEVIQGVSELRLDHFAKKNLFDPLGIKQYKWIYFNEDMVYCSGDLKLKPRDMAKIGYLMLNKGMWKDKTVLSSEWIDESTKQYIHLYDKQGYGYQWWTETYELGHESHYSFSATGWGGQKIIVIPDLDAVVILTGGNYATPDPIDEMMYRYIIPSMAKNFAFDYDKIKNEAPVPETINLVKPDDALDEPYTKLSGHWYGRGDFTIADQFVVEKIDSTKANIIYSWGAHPAGYFENGYVRKTAKVDSTGKIEFKLNEATLTFVMDKREDVLIGYYKIRDNISKLIMNRL